MAKPIVQVAVVLILALTGPPTGAAAGDPGAGANGPAAAGQLDFGRDIRPILSDKCFRCHGPDADQRESGLRLDLRDAATAPADSGKPAIVPGRPGDSTLVKRITSRRKGYRMPPPESNKTLSDAEKALLTQWIAQGADYRQHWSFAPVERPGLPSVSQASWPRNAIDRFVLARLEADGLHPAHEASRAALVRRLTFDLTGLPPKPAEIDAFLADQAPDAYERLVDRLLGSPHFGERMALEWLDAARFADTHGYHIDSGRDMTSWRAWVIEAFNQNKPFDQFTIEQLAGDLLPNATLKQRVASGFNRNHMINFEGGAIPEEYHHAYIVDRVNTTGTVWLGLTIACAQCHDHKYDPISQREYYGLYAFFNNVPEKGLDGIKGNAEPVLRVPTDSQRTELARLSAAIAALKGQLEGPMPEVDAAQARWEADAVRGADAEWTVLQAESLRASEGVKLAQAADGSIVARGPVPATDTYTFAARCALEGITALRLEALVDEKAATPGPGRSKNGNIVLTELRAAAGLACESSPGAAVRFEEARADFSQEGFPVAHALDGRPETGWAVLPESGKPHTAVFELRAPLVLEGDARVTVTLEFRSRFEGHQLGRFRLAMTSAPGPHLAALLPREIQKILAIDPAKRDPKQAAALRAYYRKAVSPECRTLGERLAQLEHARSELERKIPTAMVMKEMPQPRDTFMLERGQYDKRGDKVTAVVPSFLPPLPAGAPSNRLGLAQWLVDPAQPLTARVAVNRYWQMFFGLGLVRTSEDFGAQGERPTHPELLDWLAAEFMAPTSVGEDGGNAHAWDMKHILRLMVTSATYRQDSAVTPDVLAKDPENRLLARGPRFRLPAEFIRDQALAVSGLLKHRIGGKSVLPYQPPGLWEELMSREDGARFTAQTYVQDHGDDLYRRSMYTFWKRTSPPPTLVTFDAPDRETCTVRRSRTNTPLQALILLNDPTYIEASRKLAERMLIEGGRSADDRIAFAFRLATARRPSERELGILKGIFDDQLSQYRTDRAAAAKLLSIGESPRNQELDAAELAAWSIVANAILNLDETLTKG